MKSSSTIQKFKCPECKHSHITYHQDYDSIICQNPECNIEIPNPLKTVTNEDLRKARNLTKEEIHAKHHQSIKYTLDEHHRAIKVFTKTISNLFEENNKKTAELMRLNEEILKLKSKI